jgi:hypothetical protein
MSRRMLSGRIPNKRPVGRPRFTYGKKMTLKTFGFNEDNIGITWHI